ncbi:PASTA domain-containing protein [Streptomyces justiciae]|uniref:PASTA domain-containing protein n=1 Tax=Streptomyces justiciae TaxID=2780140 RepID=A0ABU3M7Y2_9ACTN|nr:PASTA domain-containing protein [Streptomyces justiciae]MDT7847632.1 PASTA domain-containing protein [Streptomyces justiciae]
MRTRTVAGALAAATLLTLAACEGSDGTGSSSSHSSVQGTDGSAEDRAAQDAAPSAPAVEDEADAETATLPDLVGQDLQAAQDEAQASGFYVLDDQDAGGQGRLQIYDRNWTVCSQEPQAGTYPTDTPVTLYAVKDDESC